MLREVLLALLGHTGDLVVVDGTTTNAAFKLVDVPFLHPAEKQAISELVQLGAAYRYFGDALSRHQQSAASARRRASGSEPSVYAKALCTAIDSYCDEYRAAVLSIEGDVVRDRHVSLSHLRQALEDYLVVFPVLHDILQRVEQTKLRGGAIVDLLYRESSSGVPPVRAVVSVLLRACMRLMYRSLRLWLSQAVVNDATGEFFIASQAGGQAADGAGGEAGDDEAGEAGAGGSTGLSAAELARAAAIRHAQSFSLRVSMVPSFISLGSAQALLFAGQAMAVLTRETGPSVSLTADDASTIESELDVLAASPSFSVLAFESVVGTLRALISQRLWRYMTGECRLLEHVEAVKNYMLLGRGDLFHGLLAELEPLLARPANAGTDAELRALLGSIGARSSAEHDSLFERVSLTLAADDGTDTWSRLTLGYRLSSPLDLLFDGESMGQYTRLFRFLFAVKRVQWALQQAWLPQMAAKGRSAAQSASASRVWRVRARMAFVIDNLQTYLQADVLESLHSQLLAAIYGSTDFAEVKQAHDRHVATLLSHCFLHVAPIARGLGQLFGTCLRFAMLVRGSAEGAAVSEELDELARVFERQSAFLFTVLSGVQLHQSAPHLAQLLLRMDFNRHFSGLAASGAQTFEADELR